MNANPKRRLLISRTPAKEGVIYEAVSDNGHYTLEAKLSVITRKWLKIISVIAAWRIEFQSPNDSTVALMHPNTLEVELTSPEGVPKGSVHEAPLSKISKAIVEDECGKTLGWLDYGFKKVHLFLPNGRNVGFVSRLPMENLPLVLSPSKAYVADRFELIHDLEPEFDDRLVYGWICRKVWQERDNS
jgi:hypothetical protein